jgi:hypothetical protein
LAPVPIAVIVVPVLTLGFVPVLLSVSVFLGSKGSSRRGRLIRKRFMNYRQPDSVLRKKIKMRKSIEKWQIVVY